jgi:hypothetical protein
MVRTNVSVSSFVILIVFDTVIFSTKAVHSESGVPDHVSVTKMLVKLWQTRKLEHVIRMKKSDLSRLLENLLHLNSEPSMLSEEMKLRVP